MKLININIEGNKHFATVIPFIESEAPDVLCLQEVFLKDVARFEALGFTCSFLPMMRRLYAGEYDELGTLLCSRSEMTSIQSAYYHNDGMELSRFNPGERIQSILNVKYGVQSAIIHHNNTPYCIATTHFTWTPDGEMPCKEQVTSMTSFLAYIQTLPAHCISGDFNIPRNKNPLYGDLIAQYTDAIPAIYQSSLDGTLHYGKDKPDLQHLFTSYMVDYVFTLPPYSATDVRLVFGISDHAAVVATVEKKD